MNQKNTGDYLNRHYVSAFQKIAAFQKVGMIKVGGNVASYFGAPDGAVLHVLAGPVDNFTFLKEARWVNETYQLAQLENHKTTEQLRTFFRKAHLERLQKEHRVSVPEDKLPQQANPSAKTVGDMFDQNWQLNSEGKIHLLLAVAPLPRIEQVYQAVFEKLLNEKVTTNPVAVR